MDEVRVAVYEVRLRDELGSLSEQNDLAAEDRATVALDQQAVGRLSRMEALQRQAMAEAQARRLDVRRGRIASALARIGDGEFGYCVECGEEIALARLDLDPTVPACICCAGG